MTIDDPDFDRTVTLREAYLVMEHFVADHVARGEVPTGVLLAYFGLCTDARPGDPAALDDYLATVARVLPAPPAPDVDPAADGSGAAT